MASQQQRQHKIACRPSRTSASLVAIVTVAVSLFAPSAVADQARPDDTMMTAPETNAEFAHTSRLQLLELMSENFECLKFHYYEQGDLKDALQKDHARLENLNKLIRDETNFISISADALSLSDVQLRQQGRSAVETVDKDRREGISAFYGRYSHFCANFIVHWTARLDEIRQKHTCDREYRCN